MFAKITYTTAYCGEATELNIEKRAASFGEIETKFWLDPKIQKAKAEGESISIIKIEKIK